MGVPYETVHLALAVLAWTSVIAAGGALGLIAAVRWAARRGGRWRLLASLPLAPAVRLSLLAVAAAGMIASSALVAGFSASPFLAPLPPAGLIAGWLVWRRGRDRRRAVREVLARWPGLIGAEAVVATVPYELHDGPEPLGITSTACMVTAGGRAWHAVPARGHTNPELKSGERVVVLSLVAPDRVKVARLDPLPGAGEDDGPGGEASRPLEDA
ncbi:MAG: hypothetical protein FJ087_11940 [Deltaproteobacteria bacterium]|nr:hypothetical protein [Deltaproteobacteria bacterium]